MQTATQKTRKMWPTYLRWGVLLLVAAGFVFAIRSLDFAEMRKVFASAHLLPLLVAAVFNLLNLVCKSECWRILLAPEYPLRATTMLRYTLLAAGVSVVTPLRAGEAMRVWFLKAFHKVPVLQSTGVALLEKILDAVSMFITVAPLPFLVTGLPDSVGQSFKILLAAGLGVSVAGLALAKFVPPGAWPTAVRHLADGLLRPQGRVLAALVILIISWLVDLAMIWAVLDALDIELPQAASLLILFMVNLAIAVPSTPGQVGALEFGAMTALELLGVGREKGLAFGCLYHAIQIIPLLLILVCDLRFVNASLKRTRADKEEAAAA